MKTRVCRLRAALRKLSVIRDIIATVILMGFEESIGRILNVHEITYNCSVLNDNERNQNQ
jgi:hypothetical protein